MEAVALHLDDEVGQASILGLQGSHVRVPRIGQHFEAG
jgi:hypothetical protein